MKWVNGTKIKIPLSITKPGLDLTKPGFDLTFRDS